MSKTISFLAGLFLATIFTSSIYYTQSATVVHCKCCCCDKCECKGVCCPKE